MSATDTAYAIGVIRSQEKALLQDDEYTRLIEAKSDGEAIHSLVDTPYGKWMSQDGDGKSALTALQERLLELQKWLEQVCDDEEVISFIQVRYDALNIASALMAKGLGEDESTALSQMGSIAPFQLIKVIWQEQTIDELPMPWSSLVASELARISKPEELSAGWQTSLILEVQAAAVAQLRQLAKTQLMHDYVDLTAARLSVDSWLQGENSQLDNEVSLNEKMSSGDVVSALAKQGINGFDDKMLERVKSANESGDYELAWDNALVARIRSYKADPVGYDPLLAYWLAVELEVKTIRLMLSGKLQGMSADSLRTMLRKRYLALD